MKFYRQLALGLMLGLLAATSAHAQWYKNNVRRGSDIIMEDVRWPFWPQACYFALWNYSTFPEGGYTYGGVAIHGPGTNATQHSYDNYTPAQVWTFWDSPVYKGVRPRFVDIGETFIGAPGSGEGSCAGISGWFPMMRTNQWYRMVMRAWPDEAAPATQGYNGWWLKDVANNHWYLIGVVSIPAKVTGLSGQASFVETLGGDKYSLFDQRLMYHRFEGQWYPTDTILQAKPVTDNAWDLIEDGTGLRFRRIPSHKPDGADQTGDASFKTTKLPPRPQLDSPRVVGVKAWRVGNQVAVVWQVPKDSTPSLGYRVEAFADKDCQGAPVATRQATDPGGQAVRLETTTPAQSLRLTMRDIFDQEISTNVPVSVSTPLPAQTPKAILPGLAYRYYEAPANTNWEKLPDFTTLTPVSEGYVNHLTETVVPLGKYKLYGMVYTGRLTVPQTGVYVFDLRTCDGSRLILDGTVVADNDGMHSVVTRRYAVALAAGEHTFELDYFRSGNDRQNAAALKDRISLSWEGPGLSPKPIGPESLGYVDLPTTPRLAITTTFRDGNRGTILSTLDLRGKTFTRIEYYRDRVRIGFLENQKEAQRFERLLPAGNGELWARLWYDNGRQSVDSQPAAYSAKDKKEGPWSFATIGELNLPLAINTTTNQVSMSGEGQHRAYQKVTGDFTITGKITDMPHWAPTGDTSIHPACWVGLLCSASTNQLGWHDFGMWDTFGWGMRGSVCDRDLEGSGISRYAIVPREEHRPWVKIVRRGSNFRAYTSVDGTNWLKGIDRVFYEPSPVSYVGVGMRADPQHNKSLFGGTVSDITIAQPGEDVPEAPAYVVPKEDFYLGRAASIVVGSGTPPHLYLRTIGRGVRVSADNGDTWTSLNTGLLANKPEGLYVRSVAVHPTKPNILLLGGGYLNAGKTQSGLWRSEDFGKTWTLVSSEIDFRGDVPPVLCGEVISFDPRDPDVVIAGGDSTGLFTSHDAGKTWKPTGLKGEQITVALFDLRYPGLALIGTCGDGEWKTPLGPKPRPGRIYQCWDRATALKVVFERQGVAVNNMAFESMGEQNSYIYFATTRGIYYCFDLQAGNTFYQYRDTVPADAPYTALASYQDEVKKRSWVLVSSLAKTTNDTKLFFGIIGFYWYVEWHNWSSESVLTGVSALIPRDPVSSQDGSTLFMCGRDGVYRSSNSGRNFTKILDTPGVGSGASGRP